MTSTDTPQIRVREPGELIEAIPYLLGFHPESSLVLVGFAGSSGEGHGVKQVQVALRVDLPAEPVDADDLQPLLDALERSNATSVVILVFAPLASERGRPSVGMSGVAESVRTAAERSGLAVLDVLVVADDAWWSLACDDEQCCAPTGNPRLRDSSTAAAEATYAGLVALPGRDAVAEQIVGLPTLDRHRLDRHLCDAEDRISQAVLANRWRRTIRADAAAIRKTARRWSEQGTPSRGLPGPQAARFGVALSDISVRDEIWLAIDEGVIDASDLLYELHTRLPEPYDAAPMFLYGWYQWRRGNGTVAAMAAERALESDPRYSAARLLLSAVRSGLDPRTAPALRATRPDATQPEGVTSDGTTSDGAQSDGTTSDGAPPDGATSWRATSGQPKPDTTTPELTGRILRTDEYPG